MQRVISTIERDILAGVYADLELQLHLPQPGGYGSPQRR